MGKRERYYIAALIVITMVVVGIRLMQPKPIDWSEGYSSVEKKPFGGYILFNELSTLFPEKQIDINSSPIFEQTPQEKSYNQIFINSSFAIDQFETDRILDGVKKGNSLFISAWQFEGPFSDSLGIQVAYSTPFINPTTLNLDSLLQNSVNFTNQTIKKENWSFPVGLTESYFFAFDTTNTTVLGRIDNSEVNFIQVDYGRGTIYLHTNPFLFTNYFLKDINRFDYAFSALSYLPVNNVVWDEYYKIGNTRFSSPLSFIVSQPDLKMAWFIALFGLLVYLIFGSKRTQRIIPHLKPVTNTSIAFTSTIANLYLNNGSHKDILDKKIIFLKEYIRTNLNVTVDGTPESLERIAHRSGISMEEITTLFSAIDQIENQQKVSQKNLKQITDQIDWFYKHSQR